MRPTRFAVLAFSSGSLLAILSAAVDHSFWTYWAAFLFLAAVLLGADYILGPRLEVLDISLEAPSEFLVEVEHQAQLVIRNRSSSRQAKHPLNIWLKVDVSNDLKQIPQLNKLKLNPDLSKIEIHLQAHRRGTVEIEAVWVGAKGPLGLVAFTRRFFIGLRRHVNPNLQAVSKNALQLFTTRSLHSGARVERFRGDGTEFDHLRKYTPGFDIRTIDWKASARHHRMLCRQFRAERNRQVIVAIDSGRLMSEPLGEIPRLDHAIHTGLVLAYVSLHVGDRVGLLSFDDKLRHYLTPVRGRAAFGDLSRLAGKIEYSTRETNFTLSLMELARRQTRRSLVVVMTDFVDTTTAELMVENLARLAGRHLVIFVALQDPLLLIESEKRPEQFLHLQQALVGHHLLSNRELVIRQLRRLGILCVDAPPEHVSAELIDRYLQVKRREAF